MRSTSAILLLSAAVLPVIGCRVQISSGYSFDFKGSTATTSDGGDVDPSIKTIKIRNRFGDVEVLGSSEPAKWSWTGKVWADNQSNADALINELKMKVTTEGNTQSWMIEMPEGRKELRGVDSKLAIQVPADVTVLLDNEHGDVKVSAISESVSIDHEHGDVDLSLLDGSVNVQHEHGGVNATDLLAGASIDSEHSDLKLMKVAKELKILSEHGDIQILESSASISLQNEHGKATIETSGSKVHCDSEHGDLVIAVGNANFDTIKIIAEHSDVNVRIPSDTNPKVSLSVEHGSTSSDFESDGSDDAPTIEINAEHGDISVRGS